MTVKVIDEVVTQLSSADANMRRNAIKELEQLGPEASIALEELWLIAANDLLNIRNNAVRAIVAIESDQEALFDKVIKILKNGQIDKAGVAMSILATLHLSHSSKGLALETLWHFFRYHNHLSGIEQSFRTIVEIANDNENVVDQIVNDTEIEEWKKSHCIIFNLVRDGLDRSWAKDRDKVLALLLKALADPDENVRQRAIERLIDKATDIPPKAKAAARKGLIECVQRHGQGLRAIETLIGAEALDQVFSESDIAPNRLGRLLLEDVPEYLNKKWVNNQEKERLLDLILAALQDEQWGNRQEAVDWLKQKASEISSEGYKRVIKVLDIRQRNDEDDEVRSHIGDVLDQLRARQAQHQRASQLASLLTLLRTGDEDAQVKAISDLVALETLGALRALIQEWIQWIIFNDNALLIEEVADKIRISPLVVLPLIDHLEQDDEALRSWLLKRLKIDLDSPTEVGKRIAIVEQEEFSLSISTVRRRIASQLADMSDPRFFDDQSTQYELIKRELVKHATLPLASRLPEERDFETREKLARTLGNLGTSDAVDALVRTIVDRERTRTDRQKLLDEYYLKPSKARSEEAAQILKEAIDQAKSTLWVLQGLNALLFIVGLGLIVTGFYVSLNSNDIGPRIIGLVTSLGGFASVILLFIREPLKRIQNTMADLVQIETAFTSFIWELNLNGTYIQSQYVAEGILTDQEITQTVGRIEKAMQTALNLIAWHTKGKGERLATRINSLTPAAGASNNLITLHGQYLLWGQPDQKTNTGIVALNHTPVQVEIDTWDANTVSFHLPDPLPDTLKQTENLWISLFVDGIETNAVPFHLIQEVYIDTQ